MATPIKGPPTATVEQAITYAKNSNPMILAEVVSYLRELWRVAVQAGIDPAVLAAQSAYETADAEGKDGPWESDWWSEERNPAGIGITDGVLDRIVYRNGREAAQAHTLHMWGYVNTGAPPAALAAFIPLDPRWDDLRRSSFRGTVRNVEDLGSGKWATQDRAVYTRNILTYLGRIKGSATPVPPTTGPVVPPTAKAVMPPITWLDGCQNYHARGMKPIGIIHHITDDLRLNATISWFRNPDSNASSHFIVDRDGTIYQMVSSLNAAWTNGAVRSPRLDIGYVQEMRRRGVNFNNGSITIETVANRTTPPTEAQVQSIIKLDRYFTHPDVYGATIRKIRGFLGRHADIDSVQRPYCPGPGFPLGRIITAIGGDPKRLT